jgi:transposase
MERKKVVAELRRKYRALEAIMDERVARVWTGTEARALRKGGIALVCEATGMSRTRVRRGLREASGKVKPPQERVRRPGAGRPRIVEEEPGLLTRLEELVEPVCRGDPESPLRWTTKSLRNLADTLRGEGYSVSYRTVGRLLKKLNYRLQANKKRIEGKQHPDRDAQFEYINAQVEAFQRDGQPVISVDTKKKELVGPFKNAGQIWLPSGQALPVNVHDFADEELGKVTPTVCTTCC